MLPLYMVNSRLRDELYAKIRGSNKKYLIAAQAGVGKTTACEIYGDIIADVDCMLMRRMAGTPPPPAPLIRDPQFPVNYVRALITAFETHPVVLSPLKGNWAIEPALGLAPLLLNPNYEKTREYVCYMIGINQRVIDTGEFPDTPEFNAEADRLTAEMMPLLLVLQKIGFDTVITVPDKGCRDMLVANIERRDRAARAQGILLGQEFRGTEREIKAQAEIAAVISAAYKTGLYSKMPLNAGQYFADAFADAFLNGKIEKPAQTV